MRVMGMDDTLHYLTFDPEAMWTDMHIAYMQAGGDPLYPGDEKEMLLRGQLPIFAQAYAAHDHAARMQTLRYSVNEYLDVIGEKRKVFRIQAVKAKGKAAIVFKRETAAYAVVAGMLVTDGARTYETAAEILVPAGTGTTSRETGITCTQEGTVGNALPVGMELYPVQQKARIQTVTVTQATAGGVDKEDNEAYRERIRVGGLNVGSKSAYETLAMGVSANIVDAEAYRASAGVVSIALILEEGLTETERSSILSEVEGTLNDEEMVILTDTVQAEEAEAVPYTLNVGYRADGVTAEDKAAKLLAAVAEYQAWQENTVKRAFDPYKLLSLMYAAGATRHAWLEGSHVNGGAVEFTQIADNQRLKGTVTLTEMEE